jgi:Beta-lactamase class C and other penicillin binding proteins
MFIKFLFILLAFLYGNAFFLCACANPYKGLTVPERDSLLIYRIENIRKDFKSVGLYVSAVNKGKIVYSSFFGYNPDYADTSRRVPIGDNDMFLIASVSKTFVGTAIMQLVEKNKISLDDDVNKYIGFSVRNPKYPQFPITIRMLLSHRSGLKRNSPYPNFLYVIKEGNSDKLTSLFEDFIPNSKMSYSNMGFDILGAVIENITGIRFDDYVDQNILKPLGIGGGYDVQKLDTCRFVRTYSYKKGRFVKLSPVYSKKRIQEKDYRLGYSTTYLWPAGGMVISGNDLTRYMMVHMKKGKLEGYKRILKTQSEELLWERQAGTNYGLSFVHFTKTIPGMDLIGMTGGARGIHSVMMFNPEKEIGFVVICNGCTSKSADGIEMNKQIMKELYDAYIAY